MKGGLLACQTFEADGLGHILQTKVRMIHCRLVEVIDISFHVLLESPQAVINLFIFNIMYIKSAWNLMWFRNHLLQVLFFYFIYNSSVDNIFWNSLLAFAL